MARPKSGFSVRNDNLGLTKHIKQFKTMKVRADRKLLAEMQQITLDLEDSVERNAPVLTGALVGAVRSKFSDTKDKLRARVYIDKAVSVRDSKGRSKNVHEYAKLLHKGQVVGETGRTYQGGTPTYQLGPLSAQKDYTGVADVGGGFLNRANVEMRETAFGRIAETVRQLFSTMKRRRKGGRPSNASRLFGFK